MEQLSWMTQPLLLFLASTGAVVPQPPAASLPSDCFAFISIFYKNHMSSAPGHKRGKKQIDVFLKPKPMWIYKYRQTLLMGETQSLGRTRKESISGCAADQSLPRFRCKACEDAVPSRADTYPHTQTANRREAEEPRRCRRIKPPRSEVSCRQQPNDSESAQEEAERLPPFPNTSEKLERISGHCTHTYCHDSEICLQLLLYI